MRERSCRDVSNYLTICIALPYIRRVIRSFRSKGLERFAAKGDPSRLSVPNVGRVRRILSALDAAALPQQMNLPGWRFHALQGQAKGRYAVDASGNWRITFGWEDQDAVEVDLEDYH